MPTATQLPERNETTVHLINSLDLPNSMCGIPDPIRFITEEEANDPSGRHFTCALCLRALTNRDRFGDE